jgi:hypothetical protein
MASSGMLLRVALVVFLRSVRRFLVTISVVPSSPILVTQMKEALSSSETLLLTRDTRLNIPEDAILRSHSRENLKSYMKRNLMPLLGIESVTVRLVVQGPQPTAKLIT